MNAKKIYRESEGVMPDSIGRRIDKFLRGKGITRAEFGRACGTSGTTSVTNYIDGKSKPNAEFVALAAKKFDINPLWLLLGEGPMLLSQVNQECPRLGVEQTPPTADDQVVELKHRLAEQILAGVEMRDRQSRKLSKTLEAVLWTARAYGMTQEQHRAVMEAVLDPDRAMEQLAAMESSQSHHQAAGNE